MCCCMLLWLKVHTVLFLVIEAYHLLGYNCCVCVPYLCAQLCVLVCAAVINCTVIYARFADCTGAQSAQCVCWCCWWLVPHCCWPLDCRWPGRCVSCSPFCLPLLTPANSFNCALSFRFELMSLLTTFGETRSTLKECTGEANVPVLKCCRWMERRQRITAASAAAAAIAIGIINHQHLQ